jgi:lantibiotic modifying enzyme
MTWTTAARLELDSGLPSPGRPVADGYWDLYSGIPGIALFLAAHAQITSNAESHELCLSAIEPIREEVRRSVNGEGQECPLQRMTLGALVGISSILYGLLRIGLIIGEPALIKEAHALSSLITPNRIQGDQYLDLIFGVSGTILVLLALERAAPGRNDLGYTPLELAETCARHLLESLPQGQNIHSNEARHSGKIHSPGLSHGFSGPYLSFSRLYRRTGNASFREAARELFPFTRGASVPSWCHGASGISLAYSELLETPLDSTEREMIQREYDAALALTASAPHSREDHICCGNMGRAAVLSYIGHRTQNSSLSSEGLALAHFSLRVAKTRGHFTYDYQDYFDASLFRGAAGVGYTLLAIARPKELPMVLTLD